MKAQIIEFSYRNNAPKIALLVCLTLTILTIIPLYESDYHPALFPYLSKKNPCLTSFLSRNLSLVSYPTEGTNKDGSIGKLMVMKITAKKTNETGESKVILPLKPNQTQPIFASNTTSDDHLLDWLNETKVIMNCDIFKGGWIPYQGEPFYTNKTCREIHEHQNCFKNGRPDTDFLKWRWKPYQCELPRFNPLHFLNIVRGKSMAFVGDSVARNQMQSLMCLLSSVVNPVDVSYQQYDGRFKRWLYTDYNFTVASFWSAHLVRTSEAKPKGPLVPPTTNLYLDEFDESWTAQMSNFDYVIISAGQWFWTPALFYEKGQVVGCNACNDKNITDMSLFYGYKKAFNTAFKALSMESFKGMTFLRTYTPAHFDNGVWNNGGSCTRTRPFTNQEKRLDGLELKFHETQVEELRAAEIEGRKRGLKFRALDTSHAMVLRPDGHPGRYNPSYYKNNVSDCVHWCLPGPIDVWNEMLLHLLKVERLDSTPS